MNNIVLFIILIFSVVSISGIKGFSSISPHNMLGVILIILSPVTLKKIKIEKGVVPYIFSLFILLFLDFGKPVISLFSTIIPFFYKEFIYRNIKKFNKIIKYHFYISFFWFLIDLLFRFNFNFFNIFKITKDFLFIHELNFYIYKFGIMFKDTNFSAIIIGLNYFFYTELEELKILKIKWYKLACLFFLLTSFSRAAYISFFIAYFYKLLKKVQRNSSDKIKFFLKQIKISIFISLPLVLYFFIKIAMRDGSFSKKIFVIINFFHYLKNIDFYSFLFGVGFYKGPKVLGGIAPHNVFLGAFIEGGAIFFISLIILCFWLYFNYKTQREILIYAFFCMLSTQQYNYIYLFVILAILKNEEIFLNMKKFKYCT